MTGELSGRQLQQTERIGRTFVFNYGLVTVKFRYLSETLLEWEQLKGPASGTRGTEPYQATEVRPDVYFLWWQERDTSVVTQVLDFEKERVYTTYIAPDKKVFHFEGTIEPAQI